MPFRFPYQYGLLDHKKIPYPIVYVYLFTILGKRRYSFIFDTGADYMMLPKYMATVLGIDLKSLKKSQARGINKTKVTIWEGTIPVAFCGLTFDVHVSFTNNNKTPLLLGKQDIFDRFNILFDNDHQEIIISSRKSG